MLCFTALPLWAADTPGEPLSVHHRQGEVHAYLLLRSDRGGVIAVGEQTVTPRGDHMRARLTFRFRDGSLDDETADFRDSRALQLLDDHHVQHGPSFPKALDIRCEPLTGTVSTRTERDGKLEEHTEHMDLPPDLINGIVGAAVQNLSPAGPAVTQSYLTMVLGKPRVVRVVISSAGPQRFRVGGAPGRGELYRMHIELGGIMGAIAPIVGKEPPDFFATTFSGDVPTMVRLSGPFYLGGPTWTAELASPVWSKAVPR